MDNEKDLLKNEEVVEETEETVEEVEETEDVEVEEDFVEEEAEEEVPVALGLDKIYLCDECGTVTTDLYCPQCQKAMTPEETYICKPQLEVEKTRKTIKMIIIAVVAVAVVVAGVLAIMHFTKKNPYNTGEYKDLAFGQTIGEIAYEEGMIYEKYLEKNKFPADIPEDTYYFIAIQYRPLSSMYDEEMLAMYGLTVDEALAQELESLGLNDKGFTKDTPYGEFLGEIKLSTYFGVETQEDVENFKMQYPQFKDIEFTPEMTFKEIRVDFYKAEENERLKALEVEEEAPTEEEPVVDEAPTEGETPVEGEATVEGEAPVEGEVPVEVTTEEAPAA